MSNAITFNLKGNAKGLTSALNNATSSLGKFQAASISLRSRLTGLVGNIARLQTNMIGIRVAMASFRGLRATVQTFASFQEGMMKIKAVTQATRPELGILRGMIRRLGIDTQFSVQSIQGAVFNMATLGTSARNMARDFRNMLPHVVNMATALDIDVNRAAEIAVSTLRTFNMRGSETVRIADMLTIAYQNSALNAEKFAIAGQYAGQAAASFGRSLDDVLPLLMELSNRGIAASISGTQIRSVFLSLYNPTNQQRNALAELGLTLEDVNVRTQGFIGVLENLARVNAGGRALATLFGRRGFALTNLIGATRQLRRYQEMLQRNGAAAASARQRQQGLAFAFRQVSASVAVFSASAGKVVAKLLNIEQVSLKITQVLGRVAEITEALDFSTLRQAGIRIFDPSEIRQNLERAFLGFAPKMLDLFKHSLAIAGLTLLEVIARSLPSIMGLAGKVLVTVLVRSVKSIIQLIISALGKVAKTFVGMMFGSSAANAVDPAFRELNNAVEALANIPEVLGHFQVRTLENLAHGAMGPSLDVLRSARAEQMQSLTQTWGEMGPALGNIATPNQRQAFGVLSASVRRSLIPQPIFDSQTANVAGRGNVGGLAYGQNSFHQWAAQQGVPLLSTTIPQLSSHFTQTWAAERSRRAAADRQRMIDNFSSEYQFGHFGATSQAALRPTIAPAQQYRSRMVGQGFGVGVEYEQVPANEPQAVNVGRAAQSISQLFQNSVVNNYRQPNRNSQIAPGVTIHTPRGDRTMGAR